MYIYQISRVPIQPKSCQVTVRLGLRSAPEPSCDGEPVDFICNFH